MAKTTKVLVTADPKAPRDNSIVETPPGKEDLQVVVISWWRQALIRTARTYLQVFVGLLVAGGVVTAGDPMVELPGPNLPTSDFLNIAILAASLAVPPAVVAFLQNMVELLASLDKPATRA